MAELSVNPQQWERGPKIVAVGGGTGLSTMLRGLKKYTKNLTAVVTVADDGGGSGMLRRDMGMPPPGDIRHCMEALANTEPIMQKLLVYDPSIHDYSVDKPVWEEIANGHFVYGNQRELEGYRKEYESQL